MTKAKKQTVAGRGRNTRRTDPPIKTGLAAGGSRAGGTRKRTRQDPPIKTSGLGVRGES